jgi:hypothetical protein
MYTIDLVHVGSGYHADKGVHGAIPDGARQ